METTTVRIGNIKSSGPLRGTDAQIRQLMESIRDVKVLHPLTVDGDLTLLAGECRLEACRRLGMTHVPVVIRKDLDTRLKALRAKRDENACRFSTTRVWQLALARELEELENPEAAARKKAAQAKKGEKVGAAKGEGKKSPTEGKGKAKDKIGAIIGMSGKSLAKAQAVVDAGQTEPERYADLARRMTRDTQPIDPVHQEFQARKEVYDAADSDRRFADIAAKLTETHDTAAAHAEYERLREEQTKDKAGEPIPKRLVKLFSSSWLADNVAAVAELQRGIRTVFAAVKKHGPAHDHLDAGGVLGSLESVRQELAAVYDALVSATPHAVCPKCKGAGCKTCKDAGWLTKQLYGALKSAA